MTKTKLPPLRLFETAKCCILNFYVYDLLRSSPKAQQGLNEYVICGRSCQTTSLAFARGMVAVKQNLPSSVCLLGIYSSFFRSYVALVSPLPHFPLFLVYWSGRFVWFQPLLSKRSCQLHTVRHAEVDTCFSWSWAECARISPGRLFFSRNSLHINGRRRSKRILPSRRQFP
jgi:hypothetical protein